jgi:hypothetical protein
MTGRDEFWAAKGPALLNGIHRIEWDGGWLWRDVVEPKSWRWIETATQDQWHVSDWVAACIIEREIERRCAERGTWIRPFGYVGSWTWARHGPLTGEMIPSWPTDYEALYAMAQAVLVEDTK